MKEELPELVKHIENTLELHEKKVSYWSVFGTKGKAASLSEVSAGDSQKLDYVISRLDEALTPGVLEHKWNADAFTRWGALSKLLKPAQTLASELYGTEAGGEQERPLRGDELVEAFEETLQQSGLPVSYVRMMGASPSTVKVFVTREFSSNELDEYYSLAKAVGITSTRFLRTVPA